MLCVHSLCFIFSLLISHVVHCYLFVALPMISQNPYDRIAQRFSQTRQHGWKDFEFFRPYLQEHISILDVGCGNGRLIDFLEPYVREYVGIDTSEGLLKEAEMRSEIRNQIPIEAGRVPKGEASGSRLRRLSIWVGNPEMSKAIRVGKSEIVHFEKISMVDFVRLDSFDAIFSIASFHHLQTTDHRLQTLKNFHRSLKPSGYVFMLVWNLWQPKYFWKYLRAFFFGRIFGHGFKMIEVPWKDQNGKVLADRYYYAFSKRELERLAMKSGFSIVDSAYIRQGEVSSEPKKAYNIGIILQKK